MKGPLLHSKCSDDDVIKGHLTQSETSNVNEDDIEGELFSAPTPLPPMEDIGKELSESPQAFLLVNWEGLFRLVK